MTVAAVILLRKLDSGDNKNDNVSMIALGKDRTAIALCKEVPGRGSRLRFSMRVKADPDEIVCVVRG